MKEFEEMFFKKQFKCVKDPLYRAWLNLKFAATGTETEAVDRLLDSKVAKNVQKRKTKRKDFRPTGPARHDPTSPEWVSVLTEQEVKKKPASKKKKEDPKQVLVDQANKKKGPAKKVPGNPKQNSKMAKRNKNKENTKPFD